MIQLETTITHTEKKMLRIEAPSFWKNPTTAYDEYRAVLDEKTYICILRIWDGESVSIDSRTIERGAQAILQAQTSWNIITEQEFMQAYDDAWESMRLQPKLIS